MRWIEAKKLDHDRLNDLFSLLDLKQQLVISLDIIKDLSTQILCQIIKQFLVFKLPMRISPIMFLLGPSSTRSFALSIALVGALFAIFVASSDLVRLSQLPDLRLDFKDLIAHHIELVRFESHPCLDVFDLFVFSLDLFGQLE